VFWRGLVDPLLTQLVAHTDNALLAESWSLR
jgi:hypothetical protein